MFKELCSKLKYAILSLFLTLFAALNCYAKTDDKMSVTLWGGLTQSDEEMLQQVKKAGSKEHFDEALRIIYDERNANSAFKNELRNIILWKRFSQQETPENKASFSDFSRFVSDNEFFPEISILRDLAEKTAIENQTPYQASA
ncbi:MAG: hypothetical protein O3B09_02070, partial [Proteobacteria bacterium]|nr:hypothetical protein [Pseudomonadota bacterium]